VNNVNKKPLYLVKVFKIDPITRECTHMMCKQYKRKYYAERLYNYYKFEPGYITHADVIYEELPVSEVFDWVKIK
jgi:hypothetical protein